MYIEITWCEIDRGFRMRLKEKEKGITLLGWARLYTTKEELMVDTGRLVESYFEMKGN